MSIETRSSSAHFKRAEQLKRWANSDTNREPVSPKQKSRKIKFSSGCVFLAACASGDKEEVLRLLQKGADINTANVDGLTALHQACIDDNLDMVEFLVEHGADVNRGDNEGWTPLHATASCGFKSIAKYLLEHGADVAAVNNDGELALDIAEEQSMEDLIQAEIEERGIDCEEARSEEERMMLRDAREWLNTGSDLVDSQHPKTGATALHVASAKGYIKVLNILLQCKAEVDKQDFDGWTAMHAAAHWGQRDAATILADNLADMDTKNYVGQTPFDVADTDMFRHLEELKKRQNKEELLNKKQAKKRAEAKLRQTENEIETPPKVKRVEVEIGGEDEKEDIKANNTVGFMDTSSLTSDSESETDSSSSESSSSSDNITDDEKKNRANSLTLPDRISMKEAVSAAPVSKAPSIPPPSSPPKQLDGNDDTPSWRRPGSFRGKVNCDNKTNSRIDNKDRSPVSPPPEAEVTLRRTQSFQSDPKFYTRYMELRERIKANSDKQYLRNSSPPLIINSLNPLDGINTPLSLSDTSIILPQDNRSLRLEPPGRVPTKETPSEPSEPEAVTSSSSAPSSVSSVTTSVASSPNKTAVSPATSPQPNSQVRSPAKPPLANSTVANTNTNTINSPGNATGPTKLTAGNIFKNFFKSFVPPVRDEESETQRKKHAKRVRETRRSTQGVTLDEIKSAAEQLNIKQNVNNNNNECGANNGDDTHNNGTNVSVTATITTATGTIPTQTIRIENDDATTHERRPSWRLRVDNGTSKFKLEEVPKSTDSPSTVYVRRQGVTSNSTPRPASAPVETAADATITLPLRRPKSQDDRDQDKENDARNAVATLATPSAIQRRRRPKRRSTGVVHVDMDEIDPDRHDPGAGGDYEDAVKVNHDSGSESRATTRTPRIGSSSDLSALRGENGELDYKKMYEQAVLENDRLREKLRKNEDDLRETKGTLEKINTVTSKNSLSELEKRERRAMERKLSEMEEELKQLQKLKAENERLRAENRALTRVVSKLTNSTAK